MNARVTNRIWKRLLEVERDRLRDLIRRRDYMKTWKFIEENIDDLCASIQKTIIDILVDKLIIAAESTGIKQVGIAGGVAANSGLRNRLLELGKERDWQVYIPEFRFTTDNTAMIAITGYFKYLNNELSDQKVVPLARYNI